VGKGKNVKIRGSLGRDSKPEGRRDQTPCKRPGTADHRGESTKFPDEGTQKKKEKVRNGKGERYLTKRKNRSRPVETSEKG